MTPARSGHRAPLLPEGARARLVEDLRAQGVTHPQVLAAIGKVPRHEFVSEAMRWRAYDNTALPIGEQQTISQPLVVGLMTQTLLETPRKRVLEIGTGCGYQSAVLAECVPNVFSVERLRGLSMSARATLKRLGYGNIVFQHGDGMEGWPAHSPYDGILVTAAAPTLPQPLVRQLAPGGRMVLPLGGGGGQSLVVVDKAANGSVSQRIAQPVAFVPLLPGKA